MYQEKFVVCIKSRGKILRDNNGEVFIPFSEEYTILLKNLNSVRALVKISIDSVDVLDNNSIIIEPNQSTELKGFMKGSVAKNKFKFIKKTQEISDFRGDKIDDGIIRIEYWFEKLVEKRHIITEHVYHHYEYGPSCNNNCRWCSNWTCPYRRTQWYSTSDFFGTLGSSIGGSCGTYTNGVSESGVDAGKGYDNLNANNVNCFYSSTFGSSGNVSPNVDVKITDQSSKLSNEQLFKDEGITVKGSETNQQFRYANIGPLEDDSRVILLKLVGVKETGQIVEQPLTVKTKKQCPTCGRKCKSHMKYCPSCGTFLE